MTDYIKRKEAHDAVMNTEPIYGMCKDGVASVAYQKTVDVIEAIDAIPPADVAPVRHGRWEEKDIIEDRKGMGIISDWQSARCSVCGKYHTTPYAYYFTNYEYCPSCGAKMDEGGSNGTDNK